MEVLHHSLIPILFFTGLIAGVVDAIAGGGGLISLPMLLAVGVPPQLALGTNKLQASIGTSIAAFTYYRRNLFSLKRAYVGLFFVFFGAASGAIVSQIISSAFLNKIIPFLLIFILIYTLCFPKQGFFDKHARINEVTFYLIFGFALGFYDGFFGPGTGSLWLFSLTFFLGYNFTKATAYTKIFNLQSNIVATICFAIGGNIDYRIAACMAMGQIVGGKLGAHLAVRNGATLIRPFFILIVSLTICLLCFRGM